MAAARHRGPPAPGVLAYNFGPRIGRGVTPTPTKKQVKRFAMRLRKAEAEAGLDPGTMILRSVAADEQLSVERKNRFAQATIDALAELCQGRPSREQITLVSPDVAEQWAGSLIGKLGSRHARVFAGVFPEAARELR